MNGIERLRAASPDELTEQGAFLDGRDSNTQRKDGALDSLNKLDQHLRAKV